MSLTSWDLVWTLRGGRWWIFSWHQIWPDWEWFVWEKILKREAQSTLWGVRRVWKCHSETKQREMFFIHFHFSMMNVTGQWPSSWLSGEMMERGGWLSWWCSASSISSKMKHFPKHYHHHHLPEDNRGDMTLMTLFSSANYCPHLVTLLYDVSMSLIASWSHYPNISPNYPRSPGCLEHSAPQCLVLSTDHPHPAPGHYQWSAL